MPSCDHDIQVARDRISVFAVKEADVSDLQCLTRI